MHNIQKLSEENIEKLNKGIKLIDETISIGKSALRKFPTKKYELEVFTFINYLERFTFCFENINFLLKQYQHNPNVETGIGLMLRSSLLDLMTITYLSTYAEDDIKAKNSNNEFFNEQFNILMTDQILNTFKYLKSVKEAEIISDSEKRKIIEQTVKDFSFLFVNEEVDYEHPESKLITNKFLSPAFIYKRISKYPSSKNLSLVYDLYTYYSKYEHFGIMTYFLQRRGADVDFTNMITSFKYIFIGLNFTCSYLNHPTTLLDTEMQKLKHLDMEFSVL